MITTETQIRVRYAETDQMGYVYYGNYATYFEVARTEWVRQLGTPYADFESKWGVMLPVMELRLKYHSPATYDDLITVKTEVRERPSLKIHFHHKVYNEAGNLLVTGEVVLVFINKDTMKPCRPPAFFMEQIAACWKN